MVDTPAAWGPVGQTTCTGESWGPNLPLPRPAPLPRPYRAPGRGKTGQVTAPPLYFYTGGAGRGYF